jgi:hypothetical protein
MDTLLIFTLLLLISAVASTRFIKRSLIIKNKPFNPERTPEFKTLVLKAHQDFLFPKKLYFWVQELQALRPHLEISPETLKLFLDSLKDSDLPLYFECYELVLYWHISERQTLQDLLQEINPEFYRIGLDRLEAKISHQIMESFHRHPTLLNDLQNFLFYESLNRQKLLE